MANPTVPPAGELGTVDWSNNIHNWRAEDAEFLQARSVVRLASFGDASGETPSHQVKGSVVYQTTDDLLGVYNGTAWERVPSAQYIQVYGDNSSTVTLAHLSASAGIELNADGTVDSGGAFSAPSVVAGTTLTVGTGAVNFTSSGSTVTVGGNLTATNLTASTGAAIGVATGTSLTATGTVSGSILQATTSSSLASATADDITVGTTDISTTSVQADSITSTGTVELAGDELTDGTRAIDVAAWEVKETGKTSTTPASVVTGPGPFDPADYPDGTIWIETA